MNDNMAKDIRLITVYAYHGDGGERDCGPIIGYCSSNHDADVKSHSSGFYGGKGYVSEHTAVKINQDIYLLAQSKPIDLDGVQAKYDADLKAETLASLTADQKRVLGIK